MGRVGWSGDRKDEEVEVVERERERIRMNLLFCRFYKFCFKSSLRDLLRENNLLRDFKGKLLKNFY